VSHFSPATLLIFTPPFPDLNDKAPKWKLDKLAYRLVFVPEVREAYATLFETYCNDVIDYTLEETELNNPFEAL